MTDPGPVQHPRAGTRSAHRDSRCVTFGCANAYSLAATLGYIVIETGVLAPVAVILGFIPKLQTAFAYRELNKVIPDCGTTITSVTKASGPRTGWFSGWRSLTEAMILMIFIYWGWDTILSLNQETKDSANTPGKAVVAADADPAGDLSADHRRVRVLRRRRHQRDRTRLLGAPMLAVAFFKSAIDMLSPDDGYLGGIGSLFILGMGSILIGLSIIIRAVSHRSEQKAFFAGETVDRETAVKAPD